MTGPAPTSAARFSPGAAGALPRVVTAALAALAALAAAGALAGCTSVRNNLGTRDSLCFRVIPEARAAVGPAAHFGGVRALPVQPLIVSEEKRLHPHLRIPEAVQDALRQSLCLVAFNGHFDPRHVAKAWTPGPGPYKVAIVVISQARARVVVTVLTPRMPLRFAHSFAFQR